MVIAAHFTPDVQIEKEFLSVCALLHDVTKQRSLSTKESHTETGF
jgi:HD superfamily phosphodiesterase